MVSMAQTVLVSHRIVWVSLIISLEISIRLWDCACEGGGEHTVLSCPQNCEVQEWPVG